MDTDTSTTHCGGCDSPCDPGESCEAGTCTPVATPDGGIDADAGLDGGVSSDASPDATPLSIVSGGCFCATGRPSPGGFVLWLLVLLGRVSVVRRRPGG